MELNKKDKKVLVVEDDHGLVSLLEAVLELDGYQVSTARDGVEAVGAALESEPDIILMDIMLPRIDGYELCRRFRAHPALKDIPIVFMSALSNVGHVEKAYEFGASDYMPKPFSNDQLLKRVHKHLIAA